MVFYLLVLVLLVLLAVWKRNYKKNFLKEECAGFLGKLYPMGLWIYEYVSGRFPKKRRKELEQTEAVYINEKPLRKMKIEGAKRFVLIWCCLFIGTLLSMAVTAANRPSGLADGQLDRPEFGQSSTYELTVEGLEEQEEIGVTVQGKQPQEREMMELFDQLFEKVKSEIVGSNPSLEAVSSDLKLISVTDYGVRIDWKSQSPQDINNFGKIIAEDIPADGKVVSFQITLSYADYESGYELAVRLVPPIKDQSFYKNELAGKIQDLDRDSAEEPFLKLPESLDEYYLTYQLKQDKSGGYFFILTILAAGLLYGVEKRQLIKKYERRQQELIRDYPAIVSKLNLLIGSGMTLRTAWNRVIDDYKKNISKNKATRRYAYQEMMLTANSIRAGCPEGKAYGEFGRRCGVHSYLKLGNLLEQNLRQGVTGINRKLEEEMLLALEERKSMALRLGEEAGTKLLLPMFLMLGIVIVVLIVPAFLSFQL